MIGAKWHYYEYDEDFKHIYVYHISQFVEVSTCSIKDAQEKFHIAAVDIIWPFVTWWTIP
jgi:hypothetical protein